MDECIEKIEFQIQKLRQERDQLIYGFDKVLPENRKKYEEIQNEILIYEYKLQAIHD